MRFCLIKVLVSLWFMRQRHVRSEKTPAKGINQAAASEDVSKKMSPCEFPQRDQRSKVVYYHNKTHICQGCKKFRTLFSKESAKNLNLRNENICAKDCNGVMCNDDKKLICVSAENAAENVGSTCAVVNGRAAGRPGAGGNSGNRNANDQIPLIIGFTVGGILLAIVVAGIFLGRSQKTEDGDGSEMMTTPVSLSNSEWQSNGVSNIARRNQENLRVQEASTEDLTAVPMYEIQGNKKVYRQDENGNEYLVKTQDDFSTKSRTSYNGSDLLPYFAQQNDSSIRSNRSSDVILEDGYVTGGNFVGSADPQIKYLLSQNSHISSAENEYRTIQQQNEQKCYDGLEQNDETQMELPMSLTHSTDCGGVEYVIEDQDLVAFDTPMSFSKQRRTPRNQTLQNKNENPDIMQITIKSGDLDSDFEDNSRIDSAVKSDQSDVFFFLNTQSSAEDENPKIENSHIDSPCSESGIEGSYNSKDSCEILLNHEGPSIQSWNNNRKGRSSEHLLDNHENPRMKGFFANGGHRSKSCTWRSPAAPKHSSSRKQSGSIHCPSSAPTYTKPHPANLTHVFVDVHRNMASSDEDLLAFSPVNGQSYVRYSVTDSDSSSLSEIPISALQNNTPDHVSYNANTSKHTEFHDDLKLARQKRNKSMYLLRNGGISRTHDWAPRTVRFSSSGSGEYAIPFGSLVP